MDDGWMNNGKQVLPTTTIFTQNILILHLTILILELKQVYFTTSWIV